MLASLGGTHTWIVTNSDTHAVAGKVAALDREAPGVAWLTVARPRLRAQVRRRRRLGRRARASSPCPASNAPCCCAAARTSRSCARSLDEAGATFEDLVVVGDIFELDLAMPLALGARVGLVTSPRTPAYERAFVTAHPRATLIEDLAQIPAFAFDGKR